MIIMMHGLPILHTTFHMNYRGKWAHGLADISTENNVMISCRQPPRLEVERTLSRRKKAPFNCNKVLNSYLMFALMKRQQDPLIEAELNQHEAIHHLWFTKKLLRKNPGCSTVASLNKRFLEDG